MDTCEKNDNNRLIVTDKELKKLRIECAKTALESMEKEIEILSVMLPVIQKEGTLPDELVTPMHNIISIVPEEQYRFLSPMRQMFNRIPWEIKAKKDVAYILERINKFKIENLDTKIQETDLSMFWSAYRSILYRYGIVDNSKQIRAQLQLRNEMVDICNEVIEKRTRGIETAKIMLRDAGV